MNTLKNNAEKEGTERWLGNAEGREAGEAVRIWTASTGQGAGGG